MRQADTITRRRMRARPSLCALAAALALGGGAGGAASAETLADALAKAYLNSPRLAGDRAALRALDEAEIGARGARLGSVDLNASYDYSNTDGVSTVLRPPAVPGGAPTQVRSRSRSDADPFRLGVSGGIPLYDGGRIANTAEAAAQGVQRGRADLVSTEQEVLFAAVQAFEDVRRDLGLTEVARSNVRVISEELRAATDRFEVGEVTRTDVAQAEARLAAARSDLAAATGSLARSRQAYLVAVGNLPDDLQRPPPLPVLPPSEAEAIALAEANHPALTAARAAVRQAEFQVKRAVGVRLPTVQLEGDAAYADGSVFTNDRATDQNSVRVGLRGSVPLWSGGRNAAGVREAQARVAQAQSGVHETARQVRRNVSDAWSGLEVARMSITAAREQIRAAEIAFDGVRQEAALGARTTLDVLNADQELQRARATLIRALRDEYVAGYGLLAAVGSLTVAHLGLDLARYDPEAYTAQVRERPYDYPREGAAVEWASPLRP